MNQRGSIAWWLVLAIAGAFAIYLLGNARIPLLDRDEPRYAQTSRNMLQTGDWVVPVFLGQLRTAKPPLIYWCQASVMRILGDTPFAARLPSASAMTLTLSILGIVIWKTVSARHALWTVVVLATSVLALTAAKMCITDSLLLLWITIAQLCVYALWRGRRSWSLVLILALATGLAGLTKGPVVLGVSGTTLLVLAALRYFDSRRQTNLLPPPPTVDRHTWGTALFKILVATAIVFGIVLLWVVPLEQRSPGFIRTTILHDVVGRVKKPLEGPKGAPGFYLLTIWGTFLPWSLLLPAAAVSAWRQRHRPEIRFAIAAVLGPWVMFELVQTKLPHYLLPVFPALGFLVADMLLRNARGEVNLLTGRAFAIGAGIWAIAILLLGLAPWLAVRFFDNLPYLAMAIVNEVALLYSQLVFHQFRRQRFLPAAGVMGAGFPMLLACIYTLFVPRAWFLHLPEAIAAELRKAGATQVGQVVMIDYKEPSLGFYQGGTIREADDTILQQPATAPTAERTLPKFVVISQTAWSRQPDAVRSQYAQIAALRGWNYAGKGRIQTILILEHR